MVEAQRVGMDLANTLVEIEFVDSDRKPVIRKRASKKYGYVYVLLLAPKVVSKEGCGTAHNRA